MEQPPNKKPQRDGQHSYGNYPQGYGPGYGYGYPGYGYGYGGYPGNEPTAQKTLQDYLLILKERQWYVIVAFLLVFITAVVVTFALTPEYQSTATVQIFRKDAQVIQVQQVVDDQVTTAEDLNTQVNILKSQAIIDRVAAGLQGDDLRRFLAPYEHGSTPPAVTRLLTYNREIVPERLSLIIDIQYRHPDKEIAAKVANLFADAFIEYNANVQSDEAIKAVEELQQKADAQRKKVDDIANELQAYRERNHMVSLDQRKDIVTETLKDMNTRVTQTAAALADAETRWKQVLAVRSQSGDLLSLPFIAEVPLIGQLQQQVATQKIAVAELSQRYRAGHPQMIAALRSLNEAEFQLNQAINTVTAQVKSAYETALQDYSQAKAALVQQEADSLNLDHYAVEYSNMARDYDVNEKLLEQILERMHETSVSGTIEHENSRIVDHALPARIPIFPNTKLNLGLGAAGGLFVGLSLAFFVAYLDDRVKTAFDIEVVVGLPLLGIVPEIKKLGEAEEMEQNFSKNPDREASEAFATLYSALQLKEESKKAQAMLVTSTVAGEGKSFIITNLAKTYASHGTKTVVVDCDLRRPAVQRVFHLENLKGVIDVVSGEAKLDDVIVHNVAENLDVVLTGGRSKSPTQVLNSKTFALMLSELRKRYEKVFLDTPPVAIVSDALVLLPLVDGSIYSIFFNKARRKAAQYCAQRVLDANVPNFGAVLNGLKGGISGYYYSHYYDKSYKQYYVNTDETGLK